MHYDLVTPVKNVFNKVEDILKCGGMANYTYSHPQEISKAYNTTNNTGKF